jgi:arylsulfatase A-like enzyme
MWLKPEEIKKGQNVPSITSSKKPLNIILVTFDALNAEDMSVYGYHRPTTPFIEEWAKKASVFTRVESASNWTSPALASLMTGKRVWSHRLFNIGAYHPYKSEVENLPLLLKTNGYYNMAFIANPYASVETLGIVKDFDISNPTIEFSKPEYLFGMRTGFVEVWLYRLFGKKFKFYRWIIEEDFIFGRLVKRVFFSLVTFSETDVPPNIAFQSFLDVIDSQVPEPYFAWIHLYPPHDPYLPPEPYMGMFDNSPKFRTFKSLEKLRTMVRYEGYITPELQQSVNIARARYDEFIRYCDEEFKDFINQLSKRGRLKNTIIILSSDHGESFEHGKFQHGGHYLYEQLTRIPLIIKEPEQDKGLVIDDLVEQIDITATILDLVDIPIPLWMEGRSLKPLLRGEKLQPKVVFSMNFENNPSQGSRITRGTISVWEDWYKLIYYLDINKAELFNLKDDPDELRNIYTQSHEIGRRLLSIIQDNLKRVNKE